MAGCHAHEKAADPPPFIKHPTEPLFQRDDVAMIIAGPWRGAAALSMADNIGDAAAGATFRRDGR
jgi:hypothetical protein